MTSPLPLRAFACCGFVASLVCCHAADPQPKIRISLATNETIWVGQKVSLVIELLAPGYFASAASFDLPDPPGLLLLPAAERPVLGSKQIGDVSYTVQRHELSLVAERAGPQVVPALTARFMFKRAPLDTNEVAAALKTEPVAFVSVLPAGAEGLGTVISSRDLAVKETWEPVPGKSALKVGDVVKRTISFSASDVPAALFPEFKAAKIDGLGIYTKSEVHSRTERGQSLQERRETITYFCERAGKYTIPAAKASWWDLETRQLRTTDFPACSFDVAPNPAMVASNQSGNGDTKTMIVLSWRASGVVILLVAAFVWGMLLLRRNWDHWIAPFRAVRLAPLNPSGEEAVR
jgi:hypothetical protein